MHGWIKERTNCCTRQLEKFLTGLIWHLTWTSCHCVVVWLSVYVGGLFPKAFLDPNHGVTGIQYFKKFCNSSILHFVQFWSLFFHKNFLAPGAWMNWRKNKLPNQMYWGIFEWFTLVLQLVNSSLCLIWKFVFFLKTS